MTSYYTFKMLLWRFLFCCILINSITVKRANRFEKILQSYQKALEKKALGKEEMDQENVFTDLFIFLPIVNIILYLKVQKV